MTTYFQMMKKIYIICIQRESGNYEAYVPNVDNW